MKSRFEYVYNDDNFVIVTLLDSWFKATFFEEGTTESTTLILLSICESATQLASQEPGDEQQPELQPNEPLDIDDSGEHQTVLKKQRVSVFGIAI